MGGTKKGSVRTRLGCDEREATGVKKRRRGAWKREEEVREEEARLPAFRRALEAAAMGVRMTRRFSCRRGRGRGRGAVLEVGKAHTA